MKWLEVIQIRVASNDKDEVVKELKEMITDMNNEQVIDIKVYGGLKYQTEIRVHINHNTAIPMPEGSLIGQRLTSLLNSKRMINHTVWIEKKI